MTDTTWDEKYTNDCNPEKAPSLFLTQQINRLSPGKALDLAMGAGRNSIFLAMNGYEVDAIDCSSVAVEKLQSYVQEESLSITVKQADLTAYQIPDNTYNLIINFNYLERSLIPQIKKGLNQGGMLLFETYTIEQPRYGRPRNPDYLLKPNELLRSFSDLHIIFYHERVDHSTEQPQAIASLLAQKS
jgi:2-polyprenyl-3-methyl-5-hydroxy-6-metoxy-1,4-benzoquinol methylase